MGTILLIAGESSGDLHGSNLMREIAKNDPTVKFRVWGGDRMASLADEIIGHQSEMDFMGFWEVLKNIRTVKKLLSRCKKDLRLKPPDKLVLIDFPGFNLRIGKYAAKLGIPIYWYISPQVWAWKAGRVKSLQKICKEMIAILPFEQKFYAQRGMSIHYVGHPLLDAIKQFDKSKPPKLSSPKKQISLFPGSRKQEVQRMLPAMLKMVRLFPDYHFVIAGVSNLGQDYYRSLMGATKVELKMDSNYEILQNSFAALVTSGTATLETALFKVPQVVCYKGNFISYQIGKRLVNLNFIALVNLILNREVVKELIQNKLSTKNLEAALSDILADSTREKILEDYHELQSILGGGGASAKAASIILS